MITAIITILIQKQVYDQLNNSKNADEGRRIKHIQTRPQKVVREAQV